MTTEQRGDGQPEKRPLSWCMRVVICYAVAVVLVAALALSRCSRPLPFPGPRSGMVVDSTTGEPIAGATVTVIYEVTDYPMIDGASTREIRFSGTTGEDGAFVVEPPDQRAGLFRNEYRVLVDADGYSHQLWLIPEADYSPEMTFELDPDVGVPDTGSVYVKSLPAGRRARSPGR